MKCALLADFGSTYTKLTAVDLMKEEILATSKAFTTIEDVNIGLSNALNLLENQIGKKEYDLKLACSSAAGGLRMVTVGLVKELTAKASEMAALNAGAKVLEVFSYELTDDNIAEMKDLKPEIILLAGGIDGGNKQVIIHNAKKIAESDLKAITIVAGNKVATDTIKEIFDEAGKDYVVTENVMPDYNKLNIEPARSKIREVFLNRIIFAKGLGKIKDIMDDIVMPTPSAVLKALSILSHGTIKETGLGELLAIDIGGATTDVYSIAEQKPFEGNTVMKGLPEPEDKRTVEGDLGLKYSLDSLYEALNMTQKRKIDLEAFQAYLEKVVEDPSILPDDEAVLLEHHLTFGAIEEAVSRHVGELSIQYTIHGSVRCQQGKDLTTIRTIVGTGGPMINSKIPIELFEAVLYNDAAGPRLKPKEANFYLDHKYILAAMGLLATYYPEKAIRIMKKELKKV